MVNQNARRQRAWDRRTASRRSSSPPAGGRSPGPSVRPWCWWPKSNHSPAWRGALPITGSMSGRHGRAPIQGFASIGLAQRKQRVRLRQRPLELDRRRRRIAAGKFHAGGETNAAVHRRQQIAEIGIEHGMIEHGIAARRQMQMVAALDAERDGIAERTETPDRTTVPAPPRLRARPPRHPDRSTRHPPAPCSSVRASPTRKRPPLRLNSAA